ASGALLSIRFAHGSVPGTKCFRGPAGRSRIVSGSFLKLLKWGSTSFTFLQSIPSGAHIAKAKTTRGKLSLENPEALGRLVPRRVDIRLFILSSARWTIFAGL